MTAESTRRGGMPQDQAAGLRQLMARQGPRLLTVWEAREAHRLGVAGGLASALARRGQAVLLLDEARPDRVRRWLPGVGPGAGHAVLPVTPPTNTLSDLLATQAGVRLNVVLVDALAQPQEPLSALATQAHDAVVILDGSDATGAALTAAYAGIKQIYAQHPGVAHRVLVTGCDREARAYGVFCRLATVAARYLTVKLSFLGYLPPESEGAAAMQRSLDLLAGNLPRWGR